MNIDNYEFKDNLANGAMSGGGAIYIADISADGSIKNCLFEGNKAEGTEIGGGAILFHVL